MSVYLSPIGNDAPFYLNSLPMNGGQLFTFLVNSTTPAPTYTDSTGVTQNQNPIVFNSSGYPPNEIWQTGGVVLKFVLKDANNVTIWTRDNISGINDASVSISQWPASGFTPTYISGTSFTVPGDQTSTLQVGRRVQFSVTAGTVYGRISASVFTTLTTVTMVMDGAQVLDSGLTAFNLGLLTATNNSFPDLIQVGAGITKTFDSSGRPVLTNTATAAVTSPNDIINGSLAVNQRVTMPTTDNAYCVDMVRLILGAANAATVAQDTADVPVGAGFALKLTVGAGNNNKFGVLFPLENVNILKYRGGVASVIVPLKATAGLTDGTGKIRIGILQWTSTADSISATPVSAWGAEGTNPTLIANWAFANTPAAIAVTTAWADYTVINVAISASATNLALMIWSDDKTNTTTTDILRIGGYITMTPTATAPMASVAPYPIEKANCMRWYEKTYEESVAPGAATAVGMAMYGPHVSGSANGFIANFKVPKRADPTVVYYDSAGTSGKYSKRNGGAYGNALTASAVSTAQTSSIFDGDTAQSTGVPGMGHFTADASL